VAEVGLHKTPRQHLGNAAFGTASALSTLGHAKKLLQLSGATPLGKIVPGLNLGVVALEGSNALQKYREGDTVVAATSAGNAVGCLSTFFDETAFLALTSRKLGLGASLALAGGLLGLGAGAVEVRQGLKVKRQTGSSRTLTMGVLDIASGVASLSGAAAALRGGGALGPALLLTAGLIDAGGIAVDYLWPSSKGKPASRKN